MPHKLSRSGVAVIGTIVLTVLLATAVPAQAAIPAAERQGLIDLYNATNGAAWTNNTGWLGAAGTECSWYGVTCDGGETTVTWVTLYNNNLVGTIPVSIGNLAGLQGLWLQVNQLSGGIPTELGNLSNLVDLRLDINDLTGPIPDSLGNLSNLQTLYLQSNQVLGGPIPATLGNLTSLTYLNLGDNQLTGGIPAALGNLTNLTFLSVDGNQLSGALPSELGSLTSLETLVVGNNALLGEIPGSFANLTNLQAGHLFLEYNGLWTGDPTLAAFLDSKQDGGDWQSTQTIAPVGVAATPASSSSIMMSWTPIAYAADAGGYWVHLAMVSGGPYYVFATRTADKTAGSLEVTGLTPATTYYLIVKSETDPHGAQQNTVISEPSLEVSATTLTIGPTPTPSAGPTIVTASPLAGGQVGVPYSTTFAATGGVPPYSWAVIGGGVPPGLALDPNTGELAGTPTAAGHWSFTIEVTDIQGVTDSKLFDMDVTARVEPIPTLTGPGTVAFLVLLSIAAAVLVRKRMRGN